MAGSTTAGRRLGRYHLGDPLGGGPCGAVYRAKVYGVAGFERQFAVKRFHPELVAIPVVATRLSQAARAYGSLEHPRIARLHEYGVAGGEVFTATEMVPGLDVMRLVAATHGAGAPLPPGAALALVTQAARAVGYAHGRGVNHLGLCPTNVIVTPDGDVKLTDVGVFAQTITMRPSDDERLPVRIHYLAPEQMINEATSAATDVFALGTLIHELVTGERAFVGVTTLDVEHAILSGHVRDAGLPKPMARVLARCFARSPFERFPDARALADAIDAALRVAPVLGGRRELAQIVKEAVARLDAMADGQLSGAMVLAMPMAPSPAQAPKGTGYEGEIVTAIHARPQGIGGAHAHPPQATAQAVHANPATPAIPKPPGRRASPTRPPPITPPAVVPQSRPTKLGVAVPPVPPRLQAKVPPQHDHEESEERTMQRDPSAPKLSPTPGPIPPGLPARMPAASPLPFNTPPPEMIHDDLPPPESERRSNLRLDSAWPTDEHLGIPHGAEPLDDGMRPSEPLIEMVPDDDSEGVPVVPALPHQRPATFQGGGQVMESIPPPPPPTHMPMPAPHMPMPMPELEVAPPPPRKSSRVGTVIFLLLCAGVGIGGVLAWNKWLRNSDSASASEDKTQPEQAAKPDEKVATATVDAGAASPEAKRAGVDAAADVPDVISSADGLPEKKAKEPAPEPAPEPSPTPAPPPPPKDDGPLVIESDPPGARVFVDGADLGKAPAKVGAAGDTHSIAVYLPGYELFTADIGGSGTQKAKLDKVVPTEGSGGIKILCKQKNRYYVSVDGKGTGQLCPTDRIGVKVGRYTVEIYDFVTETRKTYDAKVTGTGASRRIRVD